MPKMRSPLLQIHDSCIVGRPWLRHSELEKNRVVVVDDLPADPQAEPMLIRCAKLNIGGLQIPAILILVDRWEHSQRNGRASCTSVLKRSHEPARKSN